MKSLSNKRLLNAYYRRKFHKGKTIFARAIDYIFLRMIAGALLFLWFSSLIDNTVLVVVLSVAALAVFCVLAALLSSIRFDGFIKKERIRISNKLYTERLIMLDRSAFSQIAKEYMAKNAISSENLLICSSQSASKLSEDTMLRICKRAKRTNASKTLVFCISGVSNEAKALSERYKLSVEFVPANALKAYSKTILPTETDIDSTILEFENDYREKRKKAASSPLNPIKSKRYWLIAFALFAASFFVRYSLYYRILGGACLCFAMIVQQLHHESSEL